MRLAFDDDQLEFRDAARKVLADRCPASMVRQVWTEGAAATVDVWATLADLGVLGLEAPPAAGGLGLGPLESVLVLEEAGRVALPVPVVETGAVAVPLLAASGEEYWLGRLVSGGARAAAALDGSSLVAYAGSADVLLLRDADGGCHLVLLSECDLEDEVSVDRGRPLHRVRWTPSSATELGGPAVTASGARRGTLGTAAMLVGVAGTLLERSVAYALERHQFGAPIGSQQAVKHHLADVLIALRHTEPVVHAAAWHVAEGSPDADMYVAMAKARASETATLASRIALQIHGAIGYTWEHELHLFMKRAWVLSTAWGTAEHHYDAVARALLGDV